MKNSNQKTLTIFILLLFSICFSENYLVRAFSPDIGWNIYSLSCVFGAMVLISDNLKIENKRITKIIDVLDDHSYAIYLVHGLVFCELIDKFHFELPIRIIMMLSLTIILTYLSHRFIEKPAAKLLKK